MLAQDVRIVFCHLGSSFELRASVERGSPDQGAAAPLHGDSIRARPRTVAVHESNSDVQQTTHAGAAGALNFTFQQQFGADAADGWRVLCVRFRASFGGRVNVLSCLWAFGAAMGVHMDRLYPSVINEYTCESTVVGHVVHYGGPGSHQC